MTDSRTQPPAALARAARDWSQEEKDAVVRYVQISLREQLTVRVRRYRHIYPNPDELVGTFLSSGHLGRAVDLYDPSRGSFRALIVTALHRHCRDQIRWLYRPWPRNGRGVPRTDASRARLEAILAMGESETMPLAASLERRQLFKAALSRLSSTQRDLVLARSNGHSHEEIRDHFRYANVNTAKTRIAEARRSFLAAAAAVGLTRRLVSKDSREDAED